MKQKVLYVAALMLLSSSFGMAKKKVEDPEITKLKAKIANVMIQVDKYPKCAGIEFAGEEAP